MTKRRSNRVVLAINALFMVVILGIFACASRPRVTPRLIEESPRVLFLGDSITYDGKYIDYIEAVLRLRDPQWRGEIFNLGLPSENLSGLSEPNHAQGRFPRPDLHERLDRVLAAVQPTLVIACYGMNDGLAQAFDEARFARYQDGLERLRQKVAAAGATLIFVTPPIFDPLPVMETTKVFPGYNDVLTRYSLWLLDQRARGWRVLDVHGPMQAALLARRLEQPSFTFSKDGVHPDAVGHAVMAQAILRGAGFSEREATQPLEFADGRLPEFIQLLRERSTLLKDAWLTSTGHKRPEMKTGMPLPEAQIRAAVLDTQLRALAAQASLKLPDRSPQ